MVILDGSRVPTFDWQHANVAVFGLEILDQCVCEGNVVSTRACREAKVVHDMFSFLARVASHKHHVSGRVIIIAWGKH